MLILDAYDSFTHNLVQLFLELGAPVDVYRTKNTSLDHLKANNFDYLVLSPGPGKPKDYPLFYNTFNHFCGKIPILGVCLGMQVIAEIYGAIVVQSIPVHGKISKIMHSATGIFKGIPQNIKVARYHSLKVHNLPKKVEIQSTSDDVIMAFHIPKEFAAVQFHPESFLTENGSKMLQNFLEGVF